jgi:hypothetical protein
MMKHSIAAASLFMLAACGSPATQNAITENIADNVAELDITDVPDESADANITDVADDNAVGDGNAVAPPATGKPPVAPPTK